MELNVTHKQIKVNDIFLHVAQQGNGKKLIVLLHGWPEFWYTWRYQIPVLAEKYTVVAPDLRGFNKSDKPIGIEHYKADVVASDIAELIKQLGFENAYIVGHDWGGAIAWTFAAMYPNLTEKLAILNCPHPKEMLKNFKKNPSQLLKSWYMFMHQIPLLPEMILDLTLPQFFKTFIRGWMHHPEHFSKEDLHAFVAAYREEGALTGSINYYRAMMQTKPNISVFKDKVAAPTILIWGEDDKALGKELTYNTQEYVNNSLEIKYIKNCSHWIQNDCPDEVNQYLLDFFYSQFQFLLQNNKKD
jgi:pimeloyl-ACP methyl ester carboxylesterase